VTIHLDKHWVRVVPLVRARIRSLLGALFRASAGPPRVCEKEKEESEEEITSENQKQKLKLS